MLSVGGGNQNKEDGVKGASNLPNKGVVAAGAGGWGGGVTRSWGTTVSGGQSISNSNGSGGSPPSSRSEPPVVAVPSTDKSNNNTFSRLHHLDINNNGGEDAGSPDTTVGKKKKRGQRAAGGDKNGRGLRQFSMKVCEKVESKGRTTYNEVADELVAEFSDPTNSLGSPDQQQYDEKNIRRRVYDALNVLMAMDIISKDKKEIQWKGLPRTTVHDVEELKAERAGLRSRIEKKAAYLQELEEQFVGLQNLIQRNEQLCASGNGITGGVSLPFILVQTRPHATVEVEISEDMQLVHFDFNSTPFELHDDNYVLKAMNLCGRPESDDANCDVVETGGGESCMMVDVDQPATPHILIPNAVGTSSSTRGPTSPPLPGILKARVKHEH